MRQEKMLTVEERGWIDMMQFSQGRSDGARKVPSSMIRVLPSFPNWQDVKNGIVDPRTRGICSVHMISNRRLKIQYSRHSQLHRNSSKWTKLEKFQKFWHALTDLERSLWRESFFKGIKEVWEKPWRHLYRVSMIGFYLCIQEMVARVREMTGKGSM